MIVVEIVIHFLREYR